MHCKQLKDLIIKPALEYIDLYSETAVNLLLGTCAQESHMGKYIKQVNGPALGIFQIEPRTHEDLFVNFLSYRPDIYSKVNAIRPRYNNDNSLVYDLFYQAVISRLIYFRSPERLPGNNVESLAKYWKKNYNTYKGKGTEEEFIDNYFRYVIE